jgi:hypothetical protein
MEEINDGIEKSNVPIHSQENARGCQLSARRGVQIFRDCSRYTGISILPTGYRCWT